MESGQEVSVWRYLVTRSGEKTPTMRPLMIILCAFAIALVFVGIVLTIVGSLPNYDPEGPPILQILGPVLLGLGILILIVVLADCCRRREKERQLRERQVWTRDQEEEDGDWESGSDASESSREPVKYEARWASEHDVGERNYRVRIQDPQQKNGAAVNSSKETNSNGPTSYSTEDDSRVNISHLTQPAARSSPRPARVGTNDSFSVQAPSCEVGKQQFGRGEFHNTNPNRANLQPNDTVKPFLHAQTTRNPVQLNQFAKEEPSINHLARNEQPKNHYINRDGPPQNQYNKDGQPQNRHSRNGSPQNHFIRDNSPQRTSTSRNGTAMERRSDGQEQMGVFQAPALNHSKHQVPNVRNHSPPRSHPAHISKPVPLRFERLHTVASTSAGSEQDRQNVRLERQSVAAAARHGSDRNRNSFGDDVRPSEEKRSSWNEWRIDTRGGGHDRSFGGNPDRNRQERDWRERDRQERDRQVRDMQEKESQERERIAAIAKDGLHRDKDRQDRERREEKETIEGARYEREREAWEKMEREREAMGRRDRHDQEARDASRSRRENYAENSRSEVLNRRSSGRESQRSSRRRREDVSGESGDSSFRSEKHGKRLRRSRSKQSLGRSFEDFGHFDYVHGRPIERSSRSRQKAADSLSSTRPRARSLGSERNRSPGRTLTSSDRECERSRENREHTHVVRVDRETKTRHAKPSDSISDRSMVKSETAISTQTTTSIVRQPNFTVNINAQTGSDVRVTMGGHGRLTGRSNVRQTGSSPNVQPISAADKFSNSQHRSLV